MDNYSGGGSPSARRRATSPYSHPELAAGATPATPYSEPNAIQLPSLSLIAKNRRAVEDAKKKKQGSSLLDKLP